MMLTVQPLTPARWPDLEAVFQARGCAVARQCGCMFYRRSGAGAPLPAGTTRAQANRAGLKALVDSAGAGPPQGGRDPLGGWRRYPGAGCQHSGQPPGLIGYRDGVPVGWVSLGPREDYAKLRRSPVMKPVDDQPVWSIVCFVVPSAYRGQGVARALLDGAVAYARERGVRLLEAYPVDRPGRSGDDALWFGAKSMYDAAGFEEVARRKPERPVVRIKPV